MDQGAQSDLSPWTAQGPRALLPPALAKAFRFVLFFIIITTVAPLHRGIS